VVTNSNVIGAFSEEHARVLSGVSIGQLRRWDSDGFFEPSFGSLKSIPFGRIYSFRDIVSLRVLNDLRNNKKIPLQHLKQVAQKLSHFGDAKWTAATLYVLGKRVVFQDPRSDRKQEIVSGQQVLDIPLRVVIQGTHDAVAELNKRDNQLGEITHSRFVSQNEPVIKGTRVLVSSIKDFANAGYSTAAIVKEFPSLTQLDIEAAIAHNQQAAAA
jgi:uncharacterized protein (DUF433 family)